MAGETDLDRLIAAMSPELIEGLYVFATLGAEHLSANLNPRMVFQEAEGQTAILLQSEAERHGIAFEFPCRMITLNIHSALDAVGFLARITTELAKHNMGVNPVSAFYHDHLFVPADRAEQAMNVLRNLAKPVLR